MLEISLCIAIKTCIFDGNVDKLNAPNILLCLIFRYISSRGRNLVSTCAMMFGCAGEIFNCKVLISTVSILQCPHEPIFAYDASPFRRETNISFSGRNRIQKFHVPTIKVPHVKILHITMSRLNLRFAGTKQKSQGWGYKHDLL